MPDTPFANLASAGAKINPSNVKIGEGESQMQNSILSTQTAEKLIDLNDLRVFAYVASLASFSLAATALSIHKSSVSRSIARLEVALKTPLLQRTTRKVLLTARGIALKERCVEILSRINETIGYAGNFDEAPRRHLTVCIGPSIAFTNRLQSLSPTTRSLAHPGGMARKSELAAPSKAAGP
jgi:hypothetical protein